MAVQKKEYELSVWTEELVNGNKVEHKGAIIGAHNMSYLGRAAKLVLKRNAKGTNTLTFQMPSKFFDSELGDYVQNEFCNCVKNESKLKLKYKGKWYEFYVKNIQEEKQFKSIMYSYSCSDSFIDELSRTGYEKEFADDLNNSVDEVGNFSIEILDGSVWDYVSKYNIGDFTEFNEQRCYKIPLSQFGGSISGCPINLKVDAAALTFENGTPRPYLQRQLDNDGLNWEDLTENEKEDYLFNILSVINVFTNERRALEYGDDLAREIGLFWDAYYTDNGEKLLSNKVELKGEYIYVPLTDLSTIIGSVYQDPYVAVEEPALYGSYSTDMKKTYALQPTSKNPKDFIQFLFFKEGDNLKIDESGTLINNDCHYVIPIEEWNNILEEQLKNKDGVIYWEAAASSEVEVNNKYNVVVDGDNAYTTGVMPYTSTIDDFTWWPVYSDGYLENLSDEEVDLVRKISITDRTEYNKKADSYVTVYNNKATDFIDDGESLYSEDELTDLLDTQDFRVTSKEQTRLITPTLARNLVENGTKITDTNGWEARTQNRNNEKLIGTGSAVDLLSVSVQSTLQRAIDDAQVTIDEYDIDGTIDDEVVSDYYLEIQSPGFNNTQDFSLEGTTQVDYLLNFGIISQEKKIEKDQVYALRMRTGIMKQTDVYFTYRNSEKYNPETIDTNFEAAALTYKNTFEDYKKTFDYFKDVNSSDIPSSMSYEMEIFKRLINTWPVESDQAKSEKLKLVDDILYAILFGGEKVPIWSPENIESDGKEVISIEIIDAINGLIPVHDSGKHKNYEKFDSIALGPVYTTTGAKNYTNCDIKFLKYYLYQNLESVSIKMNSYLSADGVQLTNSMIQSWIETYITYGKIFEKKLNQDLDRIIIGKGAINLEGNYEIQGTNKDDEDYISFKDLFSPEQASIVFIPRKDLDGSNKDKLSITKTIKHVKNQSGDWSWSYDNEKGILDEPFLLFKANQTIENPYIGIKMESKPLEIVFDSISKTTYTEDLKTGIQISVVDAVADGYYYDGIKIKLVPISTSTCSEEFLELIKYDKDSGLAEFSSLNSIQWKDEYMKSSYSGWTGTTSAERPAYCMTFLKSKDQIYTIPYILILGNKPQGIVYLESSVLEQEEVSE